jgi:hypothetical protein
VINLVTIFWELKKNKNYFILTLYPFIFHVCFLIFRFASSKNVLIYTELVSLASLLLGLLHLSLTFLCRVLQIMFKVYRFCSTNRISPHFTFPKKIAKHISKLVGPFVREKKQKSLNKKKKISTNQGAPVPTNR